YLADEVITALDERLQRFLIGTAALGRFSPDLATAVTGMEDAAELARSLVRRHLFTVRLEAEGEWFRYHHLLRDTLLRRGAHDPGAPSPPPAPAARGRARGRAALRRWRPCAICSRPATTPARWRCSSQSPRGWLQRSTPRPWPAGSTRSRARRGAGGRAF